AGAGQDGRGGAAGRGAAACQGRHAKPRGRRRAHRRDAPHRRRPGAAAGDRLAGKPLQPSRRQPAELGPRADAVHRGDLAGGGARLRRAARAGAGGGEPLHRCPDRRHHHPAAAGPALHPLAPLQPAALGHHGGGAAGGGAGGDRGADRPPGGPDGALPHPSTRSGRGAALPRGAAPGPVAAGGRGAGRRQHRRESGRLLRSRHRPGAQPRRGECGGRADAGPATADAGADHPRRAI
ncbi:MAG: hypothetical protein AVDCRST_MAG27-904, partial [uncultured Craurococcus sp.]